MHPASLSLPPDASCPKPKDLCVRWPQLSGFLFFFFFLFFLTVFCRFQMTMQRPWGPLSSGQGLGLPHSMAQAWGRGTQTGCTYFAYRLIKHKQTSVWPAVYWTSTVCGNKKSPGCEGRRQLGALILKLVASRPGTDQMGGAQHVST